MTSFRYKRVVSLITVLTFTWTGFFWNIPQGPAYPAAPSPALPELSGLKIAPELGKIEEYFLPDKPKALKNRPPIIYIQDAHAVYDAQRSIKGLIREFQNQYGLPFVAVEGAAGPLDPVLFRTFPVEAVKQAAFDYLMKKGEISGVDASAVLNEGWSDFVGIEEKELYHKNRRTYIEAFQQKETLEREIDLRLRANRDFKQKHYSPELLELDRQIESFEAEPEELMGLLNGISKRTVPAKDYPHLSLLVSELAREGEMDGHEREHADLKLMLLAGEVKSRLGREELQNYHAAYKAFRREGRRKEFIDYLSVRAKEKGISVIPYVSFLAGERKRLQLKTMAGEEFFQELGNFLAALKAALFRSDGERRLDEEGKELHLLRKLASLEVTREELQKIKSSSFFSSLAAGSPHRTSAAPSGVAGKAPGEASASPGVGREISLSAARGGNFPSPVTLTHETVSKDLAELFLPHLRFYDEAIRRDRALFENLIREIEKKKVPFAMVVTGGFHTEGVKVLLREAGFPYVVVSPKIAERGESPYLEVMLEKNLSYRDFLKSQVSPKTSHIALIDLLSPGIAPPELREAVVAAWTQTMTEKVVREGSVTLPFLLRAWHDAIVKFLLESRLGWDSGEYLKTLGEIQARLARLYPLEPEEESNLQKVVGELQNFIRGKFKPLEIFSAYDRFFKDVKSKLKKGSDSGTAVLSALAGLGYKPSRPETEYVLPGTLGEAALNQLMRKRPAPSAPAIRAASKAVPAVQRILNEQKKQIEPLLATELRPGPPSRGLISRTANQAVKAVRQASPGLSQSEARDAAALALWAGGVSPRAALPQLGTNRTISARRETVPRKEPVEVPETVPAEPEPVPIPTPLPEREPVPAGSARAEVREASDARLLNVTLREKLRSIATDGILSAVEALSRGKEILQSRDNQITSKPNDLISGVEVWKMGGNIDKDELADAVYRRGAYAMLPVISEVDWANNEISEVKQVSQAEERMRNTIIAMQYFEGIFGLQNEEGFSFVENSALGIEKSSRKFEPEVRRSGPVKPEQINVYFVPKHLLPVAREELKGKTIIPVEDDQFEELEIGGFRMKAPLFMKSIHDFLSDSNQRDGSYWMHAVRLPIAADSKEVVRSEMRMAKMDIATGYIAKIGQQTYTVTFDEIVEMGEAFDDAFLKKYKAQMPGGKSFGAYFSFMWLNALKKISRGRWPSELRKFLHGERDLVGFTFETAGAGPVHVQAKNLQLDAKISGMYMIFDGRTGHLTAYTIYDPWDVRLPLVLQRTSVRDRQRVIEGTKTLSVSSSVQLGYPIFLFLKDHNWIGAKPNDVLRTDVTLLRGGSFSSGPLGSGVHWSGTAPKQSPFAGTQEAFFKSMQPGLYHAGNRKLITRVGGVRFTQGLKAVDVIRALERLSQLKSNEAARNQAIVFSDKNFEIHREAFTPEDAWTQNDQVLQRISDHFIEIGEIKELTNPRVVYTLRPVKKDQPQSDVVEVETRYRVHLTPFAKHQLKGNNIPGKKNELRDKIISYIKQRSQTARHPKGQAWAGLSDLRFATNSYRLYLKVVGEEIFILGYYHKDKVEAQSYGAYETLSDYAGNGAETLRDAAPAGESHKLLEEKLGIRIMTQTPGAPQTSRAEVRGKRKMINVRGGGEPGNTAKVIVRGLGVPLEDSVQNTRGDNQSVKEISAVRVFGDAGPTSRETQHFQLRPVTPSSSGRPTRGFDHSQAEPPLRIRRVNHPDQDVNADANGTPQNKKGQPPGVKDKINQIGGQDGQENFGRILSPSSGEVHERKPTESTESATHSDGGQVPRAEVRGKEIALIVSSRARGGEGVSGRVFSDPVGRLGRGQPSPEGLPQWHKLLTGVFQEFQSSFFTSFSAGTNQPPKNNTRRKAAASASFIPRFASLTRKSVVTAAGTRSENKLRNAFPSSERRLVPRNVFIANISIVRILSNYSGFVNPHFWVMPWTALNTSRAEVRGNAVKRVREFFSGFNGGSLKKLGEEEAELGKAARYPEYRDHLVKLLLDRIPRGSRVLSVGPGRGDVEAALQASGHDFSILAVELDSKLTERVKEKGIEVREGDVHEIIKTIQTESFDAILINEAIDYLRLEEILNQFSRILKPNGVLLIVTYPDGANTSQTFYNSYSLSDLQRELLEKIKGSNIQIQDIRLDELPANSEIHRYYSRDVITRIITVQKPRSEVRQEDEVGTILRQLVMDATLKTLKKDDNDPDRPVVNTRDREDFTKDIEFILKRLFETLNAISREIKEGSFLRSEFLANEQAAYVLTGILFWIVLENQNQISEQRGEILNSAKRLLEWIHFDPELSGGRRGRKLASRVLRLTETLLKGPGSFVSQWRIGQKTAAGFVVGLAAGFLTILAGLTPALAGSWEYLWVITVGALGGVSAFFSGPTRFSKEGFKRETERLRKIFHKDDMLTAALGYAPRSVRGSQKPKPRSEMRDTYTYGTVSKSAGSAANPAARSEVRGGAYAPTHAGDLGTGRSEVRAPGMQGSQPEILPELESTLTSYSGRLNRVDQLIAQILPGLPAGGEVMDIGIGFPPRTTTDLAKKLQKQGRRVVGVDISHPKYILKLPRTHSFSMKVREGIGAFFPSLSYVVLNDAFEIEKINFGKGAWSDLDEVREQRPKNAKELEEIVLAVKRQAQNPGVIAGILSFFGMPENYRIPMKPGTYISPKEANNFQVNLIRDPWKKGFEGWKPEPNLVLRQGDLTRPESLTIDKHTALVRIFNVSNRSLNPNDWIDALAGKLHEGALILVGYSTLPGYGGNNMPEEYTIYQVKEKRAVPRYFVFSPQLCSTLSAGMRVGGEDWGNRSILNRSDGQALADSIKNSPLLQKTFDRLVADIVRRHERKELTDGMVDDMYFNTDVPGSPSQPMAPGFVPAAREVLKAAGYTITVVPGEKDGQTAAFAVPLNSSGELIKQNSPADEIPFAHMLRELTSASKSSARSEPSVRSELRAFVSLPRSEARAGMPAAEVRLSTAQNLKSVLQLNTNMVFRGELGEQGYYFKFHPERQIIQREKRIIDELSHNKKLKRHAPQAVVVPMNAQDVEALAPHWEAIAWRYFQQTQQSLSSPYIKGAPYLAVSEAPEESLWDRMADADLKLADHLTDILWLAGSFSDLHEAGIYHRDFAMNEAIRSPEGIVLTDWGYSVTPEENLENLRGLGFYDTIGRFSFWTKESLDIVNAAGIQYEPLARDLQGLLSTLQKYDEMFRQRYGWNGLGNFLEDFKSKHILEEKNPAAAIHRELEKRFAEASASRAEVRTDLGIAGIKGNEIAFETEKFFVALEDLRRVGGLTIRVPPRADLGQKKPMDFILTVGRDGTLLVNNGAAGGVLPRTEEKALIVNDRQIMETNRDAIDRFKATYEALKTGTAEVEAEAPIENRKRLMERIGEHIISLSGGLFSVLREWEGDKKGQEKEGFLIQRRMPQSKRGPFQIMESPSRETGSFSPQLRAEVREGKKSRPIAVGVWGGDVARSQGREVPVQEGLSLPPRGKRPTPNLDQSTSYPPTLRLRPENSTDGGKDQGEAGDKTQQVKNRAERANQGRREENTGKAQKKLGQVPALSIGNSHLGSSPVRPERLTPNSNNVNFRMIINQSNKLPAKRVDKLSNLSPTVNQAPLNGNLIESQLILYERQISEAVRFLLHLRNLEEVSEIERVEDIETEGLRALMAIVQSGRFEPFEHEFIAALEKRIAEIENRHQNLKAEALGFLLDPSLERLKSGILNGIGVNYSAADAERLFNALGKLNESANQTVLTRGAEKGAKELLGEDPKLVQEAVSRALRPMHHLLASAKPSTGPVRVIIRIEAVGSEQELIDSIVDALGLNERGMLNGEVYMITQAQNPRHKVLQQKIQALIRELSKRVGVPVSVKFYQSADRDLERQDLTRFSKGAEAKPEWGVVVITPEALPIKVSQAQHNPDQIPPIAALRQEMGDMMARLAVELARIKDPLAAQRLIDQLRRYGINLQKGPLGNLVASWNLEALIVQVQQELTGLKAQGVAA